MWRDGSGWRIWGTFFGNFPFSNIFFSFFLEESGGIISQEFSSKVIGEQLRGSAAVDNFREVFQDVRTRRCKKGLEIGAAMRHTSRFLNVERGGGQLDFCRNFWSQRVIEPETV